MRLSANERHLAFEVADNGRGFDAATVIRGAGLTNMSDRVDALGGTLAIESRPGKGTRVSGVLPVAQSAIGLAISAPEAGAEATGSEESSSSELG